MPLYHQSAKYCGSNCRLKELKKDASKDGVPVSLPVASFQFSFCQNTVSAYMWDVHCNTAHRVQITSTSVKGKYPNITTIRWNDVVLAPTPSMYTGCDWSTNVVWPRRSIVESDITYRIYHVQQHLPSASLNVTFMTEMLHSAGRWYGNVCAVAVLSDKSVRSMNEDDLVLLRCAFARYVPAVGLLASDQQQSVTEPLLCSPAVNCLRHADAAESRRSRRQFLRRASRQYPA